MSAGGLSAPSRRGFLGACLAVAAAPAIVRAGSLMPVRPVRGAVKVLTFTGTDAYGAAVTETIPVGSVRFIVWPRFYQEAEMLLLTPTA